MKIYFVRHGESEENTTRMYIGMHAKLTEVGIKQAEFVAERFTKIPIDIILASDMFRAQETANTIGKRINREVLFSELLQETSAPSELLGKNPKDPEVMKIQKAWITKRFSAEDAHYSDEESFNDFKQRAQMALQYIVRHEVDNILVVTHGTFLRVMIGIMILGDDFSLDFFKQLRVIFVSSNTGITVCEYKKSIETGDENFYLPEKVSDWRLITWNDHAHLG